MTDIAADICRGVIFFYPYLNSTFSAARRDLFSGYVRCIVQVVKIGVKKRKTPVYIPVVKIRNILNSLHCFEKRRYVFQEVAIEP